ncbi:hypothetical protein E2C01_011005 [Portunus trituberculatus]|uniref:Uncharacterized protein n=1 Tax=Portunus trituberculatus TaxID=210409 RepID=A0A5B7D9X8_PORTR|nr:hypothetical protein [Portunus trituberculatus]
MPLGPPPPPDATHHHLTNSIMTPHHNRRPMNESTESTSLSNQEQDTVALCVPHSSSEQPGVLCVVEMNHRLVDTTPPRPELLSVT